MKKKSAILLIAVMVLVIMLEISVLTRRESVAEPLFPAKGFITADPFCYMRRDPDTSREPLRQLPDEVAVEVLSEVEGQDVGGNTIWYEIMYGNIHGYVSSVFVRLDYSVDISEISPGNLGPAPGEAEFRADLSAKGFPADYVEPLVALHKHYPYWTFVPLHLNYSFATAVKGELRPGVNMVTSNAPPEYKSTADFDFNYVSNTWHEYEPGWVGASEALLAFQMDPRNFLSETQIFQFENQRYSNDVSYQHGLAQIVSNTFMAQNPVRYLDSEGDEHTLDASYVDLLLEAGQISGVSPYHLAARILQELGPQGSASNSGDYQDMKGYYNFYNIGAYGGSDPVYAGLVTARDGINGYSAMKNASFRFPWDNPSDAITGGAIFIGEDYINVDQHTLYLQKFNLASRYTRPFTHQYMGNVLAPEYEAINVYKSYEQMGALAEPKEFLIPVFLDMPDVVPEPTGGGNPNNWLRSISINGEPLTDFKPEVYEYKLHVTAASKGLAVRGESWNDGSQVIGNGVYLLQPGSNEIILQVVAPSGGKRNYRIHVDQEAATANQDPADLPKVQSESYEINALGYFFGADPIAGTNSRSSILSGYELPESYNLDLVSATGQAQERAGTGSLLELRQNGALVNQFPVVIMGDLNGDGNVDILDFNTFSEKIRSGQPILDTTMRLAMDINQDGEIDVLDLMLLRNHVLGQGYIQQSLR